MYAHAHHGGGSVVLSIALASLLVVASSAPAASIYYVPAAGGDWNVPVNWDLGRCPQINDFVYILAGSTSHKTVTYDWSSVSDFALVKVDGSTSTYATILQFEHFLGTIDMYIGDVGEAWHWMEGPAYLWVDNDLRIGFDDPGVGHFYMATAGPGSGLYVGRYCRVGDYGEGDFDHAMGSAELNSLDVGWEAAGTYWLKGTLTGSTLDVNAYTTVGRDAEGIFEQTGGTHTPYGCLLGFGSGSGTYRMKGGVLDTVLINIGYDGDADFIQSAGTVTTIDYVIIGANGTHPSRVSYQINENDGPAVLNVGGDLRVALHTLAKYEQNGGTVTVGGNLEIWDGAPASANYSYVYLGTSAGTLDVLGEVINHSGYYDQDGGVLTTDTFTNNSTLGVNIDNSADFRAKVLNHTQGTLTLRRNAILRGPLASPPNLYWACNFTNDSTFQMGTTTLTGGSFQGNLANNGTFDYYAGDFADSTLTNNGTFNNNAPFTCKRIVNNATLAVTSTETLDASGAGQVDAVQNNQTLRVYPGGSITLGAGKPLVNNNNMYAGGSLTDNTTISGDVVNNDYLLPSNTSAAGMLRIDGDFTAGAAGWLRIRLGGTSPASEHDQLKVTGHATLNGKLDVRFFTGYTPAIGDSFTVMTFGSRSGTFPVEDLATLPDDRRWRIRYLPTSIILDVQPQPGDCDADGDVDLDDYVGFAGCMGGPLDSVPVACKCYDMVVDARVDLRDFQVFQQTFTGP